MRHDCTECGLIFEPRPGDTWGFWVVGDRVFLLAAMVVLFAGFRPETWPGRVVFLLLVAVPLVWTMPHRQGVAIAMDYLARTYTGDTDEGRKEESGETKKQVSAE
jgi:hypothetical protein